MRTLIRGGTVVNATGPLPADVLIDGEKIAALLAPSESVTADEVIDATGLYVIPGGVDVHTHMEMPFGGTTASDTFETGTAAAAWGGTTTIIDFAIQTPGESVPECLDRWHAKAAGVCAIDYGFHMILGGVDDESLKAMDHLVDHEGVTSFKLFMAYPGVYYSDDGQILRAMQRAGGNGAMIMMHAENGIAIDVLVAQALARGEVAPVHHGLTRPAALEAEATHRAIALAQVAGGTPLYVVHMSASEALAEVSAARSRGANVFAETCPQYLYLTLEDQLGAPGFEGAKWVCSTPLRNKSHAGDLWRGLRTDDLAVVSTDHCPFCMKDQKELGVGDFSRIPNGIGGVEHRMQLIYQGVADGQLSLARWVETCATTPARMFGLYPRKGVVAPGSDADIVLYDPAGRTTLGAASHHMNLDYSAYEGMAVAGAVRTVLSRGTRVVDGGRFAGKAGHGQYLPRGLSSYLRLSKEEVAVDFGVVLQTNPPGARVVEYARQAELAGFGYAWTFDSHLLWQEPYVIHSQILAQTRTMMVGPMVTNPSTRDWTVTASVFATLNEMFGNRTVCGIGRGDSAVRTLSGKPATLATLRECVHVVRELANGRAVEHRGATRRLPWAGGSRLEMWIAGYGPRALALAGEVGDGFILQLGDPDIARWTIASVRQAAADAGRDPDSIKICVAAPAYVGPDLEHMREQCRWFGGMVGNHVADIVARYGTSGQVPTALTDYIAGRESYDYNQHGQAGNTHTAFVPDEIVDRFCILGPVSHHIERLSELRDLGVDQFALYLQHDGMDQTLTAYGNHVIPALNPAGLAVW